MVAFGLLVVCWRRGFVLSLLFTFSPSFSPANMARRRMCYRRSLDGGSGLLKALVGGCYRRKADMEVGVSLFYTRR